MADKKISQLPASTTPLAGTEVLPIVQSGVTKQVSVADLTAGRAFQGLSLTTSRTVFAAGGFYDVPGPTGNNAGVSIGGGPALIPTNGAGAATSSLLSLGRADVKFKDLVLAGNVIVDAGKGIDFSATAQATGMTSELLDDYEEGTWTPTIVGVTTAGEGTYTGQSGTYTKIGNRVFINAFVGWSAHTGTGLANIGGLPFARVDVNLSLQLVPGNYTYTSGRTLIAYAGPGGITSTQLGVFEVDSAIAPTGVAIDASAYLVLSGFYYTTA